MYTNTSTVDGYFMVGLVTIVVAVFIALLVLMACGKGNQRYQGHFTCHQCPTAQTR